MGEEQLIDVFKSVGQVVGFRYCHSTLPRFFHRHIDSNLFRLVFDRDTGKPKGYGFCEFAGTSIYFHWLSESVSDSKFCIRNLRPNLFVRDHLLQPVILVLRDVQYYLRNYSPSTCVWGDMIVFESIPNELDKCST
jgi:hypothetical protein